MSRAKFLLLMILLVLAQGLSGSVAIAQTEPAEEGSSAVAPEPSVGRIIMPSATAESSPRASTSDETLDRERVKSIYDRIDLLKELIEDEKNIARNAQDQLKSSNKVRAPSSSDMINSQLTNSGGGEIPAPPSQNLGMGVVSESSKIQEASKLATAAPNTTGTPVLSEPVNTVELANSLFRSGNIKASLKSYEASLLENPSPGQKAWLSCFMGCCYRLSGDFKKAETHFREVTNSSSSSGFASDYANWSLEYVSRRRESIEQFKLIESEIDTILSKVNE